MTLDICDQLIQFLLGERDVTAICGTAIYMNRIPEDGTLPCIVVQQISDYNINSLAGPSGVARPRIQLKCWGYTYTAARQLGMAVDTILDGYRGSIGGLKVQGCHQVDSRTGAEPPRNANDKAKHYNDLDYHLWYEVR